MIFCRGGHGVHSPFVFDLIATVIEERCYYYCYDSLGHERKTRGIRDCFTERENQLFFRLANRFKPRTIYMTGSDLDLTRLYLTSHSTHVRCVEVYDELDSDIDMIIWGRNVREIFDEEAFEKILSHINDKSVMVVSGISTSRKSAEAWKRICASPRVTVTLDLYSLGIVFFNPKLHRKTYKSLVI